MPRTAIRRRAAHLIALVAVLFVAGCAEPSTGSPSAPSGEAASASVEPAEAPEPGAGTDEPAPPPLRATFEGAFANYVRACAPQPDVPCVITPTRSPTTGTQLELAATLAAVDVSMTWTSAGPQRDSLGLMVMACDTESGACMELGRAMGASPLSVALPEVEIPTNQTLYVHGFSPSLVPNLPFTFYYELDQRFTLDVVGRYTTGSPE